MFLYASTNKKDWSGICQFMKINKQKTYLLTSAIAVVATTAIVFSMANAHPADSEQAGRPNFNPERHEAMTAAMEAGDYDAWLALTEEMPGKGKMTEYINEDNFAKFAEGWQLMQAGDYEGAQTIREELGLPGRGKGAGTGQGWAKRGSCHSSCHGEGQGFVDANEDGVCDHLQ